MALTRYGNINYKLYNNTVEVDPTTIGNPDPTTVFNGVWDSRWWQKDSSGTITYTSTGGGNMFWKNEWEPGDYQQYDTVRDGDWAMVANKATNDRPAPQKSGEPYYLYTGSIGSNSVLAKEVICGQRITSGISGGFVSGYRVNVVAGYKYVIYIVRDPLTVPKPKLVEVFEANKSGWVEVNISPVILPAGTVFDVLAYIAEPDPSPTTFQGDWNYTTPNNNAAPIAGEVVHANNQADLLSVNKTDSNTGDRSAELATLTVGDIIDGAGQRWSIQSIQDQGTYYDFAVAPAQQGEPDGVQVFKFETTSPVTITYAQDVDFWLLNSNVQGLFIADGSYFDIIPDESQYILDVQIQNATVSEDWDLLSYSGGGAGGATAGWQPSYIYDKAINVNVIAGQNLPPPNNWQNICSLPYTIAAGDTVYEFKISVTWTYSSASRSAYLRWSTDNGISWNEFIKEPKDVTDVYATYYAYPIAQSQINSTSDTFLLDVSKQTDADIMIINFADIIVERVL